VPVVGSNLNPLVVSGTLKLAQSMLNTAVSPQPPLAIDGLFSPLTELAIRASRIAAQLPDTGSLDLQGWLALAATAPFPVLEPGVGNPPMSGPPIALVQRLLNMEVDIDHIPEDGVFSTATADRVKAFQTERGLPATGTVDLPTWLEVATLFDLLHAIGAERVVLGFDRARSEAGGEALVLISRETLDDAALPPSDPLDEDLSNQTGLRVELQDSRGEPLFRKRLGHLLSEPEEVRADSETGSAIGRPGPAREEAVLNFVLPVISGARRLVVFGTIQPNDQGPAAPIAVFEPF
jgi:peptidoglycan hydrolase-like protein with peptidoglycan-binding domain